jgi:transposase
MALWLKTNNHVSKKIFSPQRRLSAKNMVRLREILDLGSVDYDLEGVFWGRKRVKYVIKQEFDIDYDVEHISEMTNYK